MAETTDLFTRKRRGYFEAFNDGDLRWGMAKAGCLGFHTKLEAMMPQTWLSRLIFQLHHEDGEKSVRCIPEWTFPSPQEVVVLLYPEKDDAGILAFAGPDPLTVPASWIIILDGNVARLVRNRSSNKTPCPPPPDLDQVDLLVFPEYPPPAS